MIYRKCEHVSEARENMRGGDGAAKLTALAPDLPENLRLFSEIRLDPGCSIGYHVHENETELFYFISGSGVVMDGEDEIKISAGDTMATPSGSGHSVKNDGAGPLVFVAVIVLD